jgi:hypothetical protein
MSQTHSATTPLVVADGGSADQLRLAADFEARWAAWQVRGRAHERAVRRKLFTIAPVIAAVSTILYVFVNR